MAKKRLPNITQAEMKAKGVASLADKPNAQSAYGVGGLTATTLKLWFDQLPKFIAEKINAIQDVIAGTDAAQYIAVDLAGLYPERGNTYEYCLQDLLDSFKDGKLAAYLQAYPSASEHERQSLQTILNGIAQQLSVLNEALTLHKNDKSNPHEVTKAQVGLGNADNTPDSEKNVATAVKATQDADGRNIAQTYETKADANAHKNNTNNPHGVSKAQLGLDLVDNTPDRQKRVAHADKATQDEQGNDIGNTYATKDALDETRAIAEGRVRAVAYSTTAAMQAALRAASNTDFKVGDTIYIIEAGVPDWWITNVLPTNSGEYGYYELAILETEKVDLAAFKQTLAAVARTGKVIDLDKGADITQMLNREFFASYENLDTPFPMLFAASPPRLPTTAWYAVQENFQRLWLTLTAYEGLLVQTASESVDSADWKGVAWDILIGLKQATEETLGGIKVGFQQRNGEKKYPVLLDDEGNAYVVVPWAEQMQADWEETNPLSPKYIHHKPSDIGGGGGDSNLFVFEAEEAQKARGFFKGGAIDKRFIEVENALKVLSEALKIDLKK